MFEGLKIPRAHAPITATASSSGSEGPLISDTLPSDYPSESHSEIEDVDTRSLPVSSAGSFENKGYIQETSSFYSEGYGHTQEIQNSVAQASMVPRLPLAVKEQPKFDVQLRVKRAPPPPPSQTSSDSESSVARTERNLTTILEQREDSIRTIDEKKTQFSYVPEIHAPPRHIQQPPVYSRILRRQQELHESSMEIKPRPHPEWEELDSPQPQRMSSARSMTSLNTEMTDTHSMTEMVDSSHSRMVAPTPPPPPPIVPKKHYQSTVEMEQHELIEERPIAPYHQPEITSHTVDDVFLKTITEKRTIEDIERHKRLITEYYTRPKLAPVEPDRQWDVTIRNIPKEGEGPDWENFSDISSASNLTLTPKPERAQFSLPPQSFVNDSNIHLFSPELVAGTKPRTERLSPETYISTLDIPVVNEEVPNWNVLIRVLKPEDEPQEEVLTNHLSLEDRLKWRKIITTESTLRTLLTEAVIREDFERIRHDQRYEKIFEPPKWDVIIRVLSPPERPKQNGNNNGNNRYRKKSDWDSRSRRSSLPTLYEYDSDGGSSIRTLTNEPPMHGAYLPRTRRSSRSSYRSEADLRSMSEVSHFGYPLKISTFPVESLRWALVCFR